MQPSIQQLNPSSLPEATGNYTHGVLVTNPGRTVYVSGQVPWADADGEIPADFETQCRLVWQHIIAVLAEAGMTIENLAKVTTYLSDREYRAANSKIREEILGEHCPALTIIITDIYAPEWLLEIEAIAVGA